MVFYRSAAKLAVVALFAGIGSALILASAHAQDRVTMFAAASLKTALDTISQAWKAQGGGDAVISYAASSALAKQIEAGAPADLFISADLDWMRHLSERGFIKADTEVRLLANRLVLVAPAQSGLHAKITPELDLRSLLKGGRLAMGNVDAVPAGKYGKAALEKLGLWTSVSNRVAQAQNVRAALALVSMGEAPLGVVYETDALADPRVSVVGIFPEDTHEPIIYPAAQTSEATSAQAGAFLRYLKGAKAKKIFDEQGFTTLVLSGE